MTEPAPTPKPTPPPVVPMYELTASRRGLIMSFGKLEEHAGRLADLPKQPDNFHAHRGSYATVSAIATRLNEAQIGSQYLDFLYAPEPVPTPLVTA